MRPGIQSRIVRVPRSGISTDRCSTGGSVAGRHDASVRRVDAICRPATSAVGGGYPTASWPTCSRKKKWRLRSWRRRSMFPNQSSVDRLMWETT
jgi:hypothetical protein